MTTSPTSGSLSTCTHAGCMTHSSYSEKSKYKADISNHCLYNVLPILQLQLQSILQNKEVNDYILAKLRLCNILDQSETTRLQSESLLATRTESERVKALVELFYQKSPNSFNKFLNVLLTLPEHIVAAKIRAVLEDHFEDQRQYLENCPYNARTPTDILPNDDPSSYFVAQTGRGITRNKYELHMDQYNLKRDVLPTTQSKIIDTLGDREVNNEILRQIRRQGILSEAELDPLLQKEDSNSTLTTSSSCSRGGSVEACMNFLSYSPNSFQNVPVYSSGTNQPQYKGTSGSVIHDNSIATSNKNNSRVKCYLLRKRYLYILAGAVFCSMTVAIIALVGVVLSFKGSKLSMFAVKQCKYSSQNENGAIRSIDEYNETIRKGTIINKTSVVIKIFDPSTWPLGVPIEKSVSIRQLQISGKIHVNKVIDLLANAPSTQDLTISNECNMVCSEAEKFQARVLRKSVNVSNQKLTLEDLGSSCGSLLSGLESQVTMHSLEEVKLIGGSLDIAVMTIIENILIQANNTLTRIEISNNGRETGIFGMHKSMKFPKVKSVVYDVQPSQKLLPTDSVCRKFPSLQHFSSNNLFYINNLRECFNLKTIKVQIQMHHGENSFDLNLLHKLFPLLQSAHIKLLFPSCEANKNEVSSTGGLKYVLGKSDLPDALLVNLKIKSNCKLNFL